MMFINYFTRMTENILKENTCPPNFLKFVVILVPDFY